MPKVLDLRKKQDEEEEKKKGLQPGAGIQALNQATQAAVQTQQYKALPEAEKVKVEQEAGNIDKVIDAGKRELQQTAEEKQAEEDLQAPPPKEPSVKDSFLNALTFFLPTIGGAMIGGAFEGSAGAFKGGQMGMEAGKQYRDWQLEQQKLQQRIDNPLAAERLALQKGNLEARKLELEARKEGQAALEYDREGRRTERSIERTNKFKEQFIKRKDIIGARENLDNLDTIEALITEGKKIPGALVSKVARAISGEVGVLTEQDVSRSQVNPDFLSKLKRGFYNDIKGEISPDDAKEMSKIVKVFKEKYGIKIQDKIKGYALSRTKGLSKTDQESFEQDLTNEFRLSKPVSKGDYNFSRDEIEAMKAKLRGNK